MIINLSIVLLVNANNCRSSLTERRIGETEK